MDQHLIDSFNSGEDTPETQNLKNDLVDRVISMVLEKKYGVPNKLLIFQEDIMALCSYGANFTLGEADDIRRAMGKKKIELMDSFKDRFISNWNNNVGCFGEEVWDKMKDYAKYCFNKSHAVAYTLVTLKTASLQKYNFDQYMAWNYMNLKNDMKAKAATLLEENAPKTYPKYKMPYEGVKFGDSIEFKNIKLDETCNNYIKEYEYLSDLFMTSDIKYKAHFFLRGLFDPWTPDILGLVKFKKKLGKKADAGLGVILPCNSFDKFLEYLSMKKYIKYVNLPDQWQITTKVKVEPKDSDWVHIYKNLDSMPQLNRNYRATSLIKEFGITKNSDFSSFNLDGWDEISRILEKYKEIFDRFKETNPDKNVKNKKFYEYILSKTKILENRIDAIENTFGELRACVQDIDIKKDGSCKVQLQFKNTTRIFYTKYDEYIKKNWHKNDIVQAEISFYRYQGRDGYPKIILNLNGICVA